MKKITNVIIIYFKILLKSYYSLIYILPTFILTSFMFYISQNFRVKSLGIWVNASIYINLFFGIGSVAIGIFTAHSLNEIEETLDISKFSLNIGKLIATILFSQLIMIAPIIIILVYGFIVSLPLNLILNFIIYIIITWGLSICMFCACGFLAGLLVENKAIYLFTIVGSILFSPYNYRLTRYIELPQYMNNLINPTNDFLRTSYLELQGFSYNKFFWLDKLFFLVLVIMMISLVKLVSDMNKERLIKLSIKLFGILFGFTAIFMVISTAYISEGFTYDYEGEKRLSCIDVNNKVIVENYDIDVDLKEEFRLICRVMLKNQGKIKKETLAFNIDESIRIKEIEKDGQAIKFSRTGDVIHINNIGFLPFDEITVTFKCEGRVDYRNECEGRSFYVDNNSAVLHYGFSWYPQLLNNRFQVKQYSLNVKSKNCIVSNLSNNKVLTGKNEYYLKGKADNIYLYSGFFKTTELKDNTLTAPIEFINCNNIENIISDSRSIIKYKEDYLDYKTYQYNSQIKVALLDVLGTKPIIVVPLNYDNNIIFIEYNDFIIINEIILK